uniref:Uncharacterized protein n=1 Tax=Grammatophora oceanica TaxID=210454 RepID=A0A7S1UY55_9STRA|mmetsp:Transcript_29341/g.43263  ORF Transcript_29341/g.43263 Transcript_29341/m.43263 type:complete len:280 (+) Transcript_29341:262-1101(+)|eukprot:CAMPEP_0194065478 /NCGR_PEP_ID=MMETSP0009_2-20130614/85489_1 /TAXON_ID=210454 /ORGANISM="Grammatophora oceanica, Strain CCMP 410" /LENGTH=279 /DNA_ID=CAMNT_0038718329 /DNA_START=553 /DNA_END=1392 /DNA_ORIENTATION=+
MLKSSSLIVAAVAVVGSVVSASSDDKKLSDIDNKCYQMNLGLLEEDGCGDDSSMVCINFPDTFREFTCEPLADVCEYLGKSSDKIELYEPCKALGTLSSPCDLMELRKEKEDEIMELTEYELKASFGLTTFTCDMTPPYELPLFGDFYWAELPKGVQDAAAIMGFDEEMWDAGEEEPLSHSLDWEELSAEEAQAAIDLGYDQAIWDEEDPPLYDEYKWEELPPYVKNAALSLGYDQEMWDAGEEDPETEDKMWTELSFEEREAAQVFGWEQHTWDGMRR